MQIKRTVKIVLASVLALACLVSMFACGKKDKTQAAEDGHLPIQWVNKVYYFQQGMRTDWKFINISADKKMVNRETGLVCQLAPVASPAELTEEQIKAIGDNPSSDDREAAKDVEYSIYYFGGEGVKMTDATADVVKWMQDENSEFYFNTKHNTGSPREAFHQDSEPETYTAKFSKLQFNKVTYSFTRDGDDWQGEYNLVMNGQKYFVVTFEAKKDIYKSYYEAYEETIGDFRKEGWETA